MGEAGAVATSIPPYVYRPLLPSNVSWRQAMEGERTCVTIKWHSTECTHIACAGTFLQGLTPPHFIQLYSETFLSLGLGDRIPSSPLAVLEQQVNVKRRTAAADIVLTSDQD